MNELIIIGSGPAGLTAAIYASRGDLKPLLFAGSKSGGQLMTTTKVENFPGFPDGVMGPKLMVDMIKQAQNFGTEILNEDVTRVDFAGTEKKVFVGEKEYRAKCVIIATGASSRILGIESETKFWGKGVSTCATCDGSFYRGKMVAVIGGGDSAAEESNFLTKFALKVYLIVRKDVLKASKIMAERVLNNPKIEIVYNTEVKEVLGNESVTGLRIFNSLTNQETNLTVDGMFLAIGHVPNTKFLNGQVEIDELGFIKTKERTHTYTNIEGVFVAGDVFDHRYRQAITASGMGCMAAIDAERWLNNN